MLSTDARRPQMCLKAVHRHRGCPAPAAHAVARRAEVVLTQLFIEQCLLRGAAAEEFRIGVLRITIEFTDHVELWSPEIHDVDTPARGGPGDLKLRYRATHPAYVRSAHGLAGTIGRTIRELDC